MNLTKINSIIKFEFQGICKNSSCNNNFIVEFESYSVQNTHWLQKVNSSSMFQ